MLVFDNKTKVKEKEEVGSEVTPLETVCPACNYRRQATDTAPDWQCPCCEVAYVKVSPEYQASLRARAKAKIAADQETALEEAQQEAKQMSLASLLMGGRVFANGFASRCNQFVSSPKLWVLGARIMAGSVLWMMYQSSR